jgi:Plasmid pRiA4b ORF-3-like protein
VAEVYVFDARIDPYSWGDRVTRRLALRGDETLEALHRLIQEAFEWDDDHLYSFWLDGKFWGAQETEYTSPLNLVSPLDLFDREAKSARVEIGELGLEPRQKIAYVFDFGDEWRVRLSLRETRSDGETGILDRKGESPPQYPVYEDEE